MLDRMVAGSVPRKHHVALRGPDGALRYEQCLTRDGFDGAYSILYHVDRPHALEPLQGNRPSPKLIADDAGSAALLRRHYRSGQLPAGGTPLDARMPLLWNADVTLSVAKPTVEDMVYFVNADADELFFVHSGGGRVRSPLGDLAFAAHDYVCIPKGIAYRLIPEQPLALFLIECHGGVSLPARFRNALGQLRMDAPYCHRDFKRPEHVGPIDEGIRELVIKRGGQHHGMRAQHSLLDVVGWDGTVYPWAFPITAFQPRVSSVHLPPTWHGTFETRGALICSFVPRPLDFAPDAVPCPYPHSSVDVDEVLYYVSGAFGSRSGVGPGSISLHPAGIPHGPHPGRYEASLGAKSTDEIAVMLDCYAPLQRSTLARACEDAEYDKSFR
jgi:homogentisate 1,2-dioxygenase